MADSPVFLTGEEGKIGLALEYLRRVEHLSGLEATCGEETEWIMDTRFQTYLDLSAVYAAMGHPYPSLASQLLLADPNARALQARTLQNRLYGPQQETSRPIWT